MKQLRFPVVRLATATLTAVLGLGCITVRAWDYPEHRVVNQIALASLPSGFPGFVSTPEAAERIAFLAGEPDRWRNNPDLTLKHFNGPDHYMDMDELGRYHLKPSELPVFRYDFVAMLARERAAHPENFPPIDPEKNRDHTRELIGMLPWAITENYGKLESGFSYLKTYEQFGGTPAEIANAKANIIYIMGVMGHYVGDGSQPLHTTIHHAGWVGDNPHGYTTWSGFHHWIDGGYFDKVGLPRVEDLKSRIRTAHRVQLDGHDASPQQMFQAVVQYLETTSKEVEPLYQLDKDHKLSGKDEKGREGKEFLTKQLIVGGQMLGDLWYSAWKQAPPDDYLKGRLLKRGHTAAAK